jgi:hypothetical protein
MTTNDPISINSTITVSILNDLKKDVTFLSDHWLVTEARLEHVIINPKVTNASTKDLIKIQEEYDKKLLKLYREWKKGYSAILQVLE